MPATLQPALNPPESEPFVPAIGRLLVNMGHIEMLTCLWLEALARAEIDFKSLVKIPLKDRIMSIITKTGDLNAEQLPDETRTEALKLWRNLGDGINLRNAIAHSPCVFARVDDG